jgi:heme exporter protein D
MSAEFWSMGGYALYVWGSFGAALAVFAWNVVAPRLERRAVLRRLREGGSDAGSGA